MKKRSEKQADLDKLKGELAKVSTVILTTFQGITVQDDTKLRRSVQAAGGNYKVVKNTIAERAASGTPAEKLLTNLKGTNSIAYTNTDPVALAKALTKIAKDVPAFQFRSGIEMPARPWRFLSAPWPAPPDPCWCTRSNSCL